MSFYVCLDVFYKAYLLYIHRQNHLHLIKYILNYVYHLEVQSSIVLIHPYLIQ